MEKEFLKKPMSRRMALGTGAKVVAGAAVAAAVAGAAGYYGGIASAPGGGGVAQTVTQTQTVSGTVTGTVAQGKPGDVLNYPNTSEALKKRATEANINWRQFEGQTIRMNAFAGPYGDALVLLAGLFKEISGITVIVDSLPVTASVDKTLADITAHTGTYNTFWGGCTKWPRYAALDGLQPLNGYIDDPKLTDKEWFDFNDYFPGNKDKMIWHHEIGGDDKIYALPWSYENHFPMWQKAWFDEKEVGPPDNTSQFLPVAKAIHDPSKGRYAFAARAVPDEDNFGNLWGFWIEGYCAGNWYGFWHEDTFEPDFATNEWMIEGTQTWITLMREYGLPNFATLNDADMPSIAAKGSVGLECDYFGYLLNANVPEFGGLPEMKGKWWSWMPPQGEGGYRCPGSYSWMYPLNKDAKNKEAAWLWLEWLQSKEVEQNRSLIGTWGGNARMSTWQHPAFKAVFGQLATNNWLSCVQNTAATTQFKAKDPEGKIRFHSIREWPPAAPEEPEIMKALCIELNKSIVGTKTVKDALKDAEKQAVVIMKNWGHTW